VTIRSESGPILLFDGRNQAQNGWFVVRTLIPSGKTGDVVVWHIQPNVVAGWIRRPVIGCNQVGYTPGREKVALIELDPLFDASKKARVLRLTPQGEWLEPFSGEVRRWGKWMRYEYASFDFSAVRDPGMYAIEYAGQKTGVLRIAPNVYDGIWNLSLNTGAADNTVNLVGCKSPHHQLPVFGWLAMSDACGGNEACSARIKAPAAQRR
jgi:hypothetical protein